MGLFKKDSEKLFDIKVSLKGVEFGIKYITKDLEHLEEASSDIIEFYLSPETATEPETFSDKLKWATKKQRLIDQINNANSAIYLDVNGGIEPMLNGKEHRAKGVKEKIAETAELNEQLLNKTKEENIKKECENIKDKLEYYKKTLALQLDEQKNINTRTKHIVSPQKTSSLTKEDSKGRDYE